jgi:hypothetical protein
MSSRSTREVSHDPRDTMQVPRKSSRLNNKGPLNTSRRFVSSKASKAPRITKSSPSSEKSKLVKLKSTKKENFKDNDRNDSKSNSASMLSLWGSPDLSAGVENVFKLIKLHDDVKILIISMNLCNVRNMIQLSGQVLQDVTDLFSRQDLSDPIFRMQSLRYYAWKNTSNC